MPIYLTEARQYKLPPEYVAQLDADHPLRERYAGRLMAGPRIHAETWEEAERKVAAINSLFPVETHARVVGYFA